MVVTGRVTDAALVTGPAAAHFGWEPTEYDRLAGAVVAGHLLECGAQATGGNYAFFQDGDVRRPGFPLAELHADGTSVVTKHDGTGGFVDVGTVTAQLLYETGGARYAGPDVTARLDTVRLSQDGPDRVRVAGVRGEAPPPTLKVGLNRLGGFRNEVAFVLTGLDVEAKAELVRTQLEPALGRIADVRWDLVRTDRPDALTEETAGALLRLVVRDADQQAVGRALSGAAIELALASYPGFHVLAPPGKGAPYGVFEDVYVPHGAVDHVAVLHDGRRVTVAPPPAQDTVALAHVPEPPLPPPLPPGPVRRAPSASSPVPAAATRAATPTSECGRGPTTLALARPRADRRPVPRTDPGGPRPARHPAPVPQPARPQLRRRRHPRRGRRRAGRFDPQAKALGEWLRARHLDIPESLL